MNVTSTSVRVLGKRPDAEDEYRLNHRNAAILAIKSGQHIPYEKILFYSAFF